MLGEKVKTPIHDTYVTESTIRYKDWKLFLKDEKIGGSGNKGLQGRKPAAKGSLFNVKDDVGETTDLSAQYPEKVAELMKMAESYQKEFAKGLRKPATVEHDSEEPEKETEAGIKKKKKQMRSKNQE
jgi:hypothetical protein